VRSITFVFKVWCTSIQKFVVSRIQTGAQRNEIALAGPHHDIAHARARRVRAPRRPRPRLPHAPHGPRLLGVLLGRASPIVRAVPAGRAPRTAGLSAASHRTHAGRGRRTTAAYSRSRRRHHRSSPPLFKAAFHPRARHHCHSRRHDRLLSELPFFPSVSSPADTSNTSSSSHVSRSLCLWASRKLPSPATPPAAAATAGPRRAPTSAISPPQLWPPLGPK
jgi:hypothetical protein